MSQASYFLECFDKKVLLLLLVIANIFEVSCHFNSSRKQPIYLWVVLPYFDSYSCNSCSPWIRGEDIQPAMELARDQINNNSLLLQNHSLELLFINDGCQNTAETIYNFVEKLVTPGGLRLTGLIGPTCDLSTAIIANIIKEEIVALHPSDDKSFQSTSKLLLGSMFSSKAIVDTIVFLIKEAHWTNIRLLIDGNNEFYRKLSAAFSQQKLDINISTTMFDVLPSTTLNELIADNIFSKTIIVFAPAQIFKKILCLPVTQRLEHYQWVYIGPSGSRLTEPLHFTYDGTSLTCSKEYYEAALELSLLITPFFSPFSQGQLLNQSLENYYSDYEEYRKNYNNRVNPGGTISSYSEFASFFYDIVWAWALALDQVESSLNFSASYGNAGYAQNISHKLAAVHLEGISEKFVLNRLSSTLHKVDIIQFCGGKWTSRDFQKTDENGCQLTYSALFLLSLKPIEKFLLLVIGVQAAVVFILQLLTVTYRNKPSVKAVDRHLLHISYIGAYVLQIIAINDILRAVFRNFTLVITTLGVLGGVWLLPIGVTFLISSVIARSWRVYRLFIHTFHPGRCMTSNRFIFGFILTFIFVDIFLATFTTILIFCVYYSSLYHRALTYIIYFLFAIVVIVKIGTFVVLCILTFLTEKISKAIYSTRPYYFVLVFNVLLLGLILFNIFVFHTSFNNIVLSLLLEITIYIFFVFLPPLIPILRSLCVCIKLLTY